MKVSLFLLGRKTCVKLTLDFTLAGVPDLLLYMRLSLPDGDGAVGGTPAPDKELGDGLLDLHRIAKDGSAIPSLSFSSIILAGDLMSTFGSPTVLNVLWCKGKFDSLM